MTAFNVAGLLHEPPGAVREHHLRDHYVSLGSDIELAGPMDVDVRLQRTNRGVLVRGMARVALRRSCARCLEPYVDEVTVPIDEEFLPSVDPESGTPLIGSTGDEEVQLIDPHHEIVLDQVLRDELLLTEPMHPLCRPDCPGLCTVCGQSLASGPHDHGPAEIDPRLASLARLLGGPREQ